MRIIAGRHRGRRIHAPKDQAIRPTADRVRESVFSILGDLHDFVVVDGFAGTGALGCEALSRGARKVWFFDSSRDAIALLQSNLALLKEEGDTAVVVQAPFARALAHVDEAIDLVFLDPPYHTDHPATALAALQGFDGVTADTLIVLEQDHADERPQTDRFEVVDERRYGSTRIIFYRLIG